jgi:general stress protein 26
MTTSEEDTEKIATLVKAARIGVLTTQTKDGQLVSRPLAMQEIEFTGDLWFFTQDPSPKVDDIGHNDQVNVAFDSGKGWVSLSGVASVSHDKAKIDELWNTAAEAWFPDGKDDPSVALIRVEAESAEYWSSDDPKPVALIKVAKAALTGGQPDIGENKTVEF